MDNPRLFGVIQSGKGLESTRIGWRKRKEYRDGRGEKGGRGGVSTHPFWTVEGIKKKNRMSMQRGDQSHTVPLKAELGKRKPKQQNGGKREI